MEVGGNVSAEVGGSGIRVCGSGEVEVGGIGFLVCFDEGGEVGGAGVCACFGEDGGSGDALPFRRRRAERSGGEEICGEMEGESLGVVAPMSVAGVPLGGGDTPSARRAVTEVGSEEGEAGMGVAGTPGE